MGAEDWELWVFVSLVRMSFFGGGRGGFLDEENLVTYQTAALLVQLPVH
jgi:hypothetical protein